MSRKISDNIAKALPSFLKNATQYLKNNFDENGAEILENANGTTGVLIKLFAQPLLDKYFDKLTVDKLHDFGFQTYLKASLIQANKSLEEVRNELDELLNPNLVFEILEKSIHEELITFNPEDVILIFQPKYHPAVVFIKKNYQRILNELGLSSAEEKVFIKHFNENIVPTVIKEFGEDYDSHLEQTDQFRLRVNETDFLWDTIRDGKIGFKESENLKYEPTYAKWEKVGNLRQNEDNDLHLKKNEIEEDKLKPIEELIEDYFSVSPNNHLEQILFIIADFGKGKSVFMKHYAAELAKRYLQEGDGYFPIYFNLRNYRNYSNEPRLGVISDYLETKYSIKIDDEHFQNNRYIFLVDSLDESGELNKRAIDNVISSVKRIQGINKSKYKENRLIITSRPFDEGLSYHLEGHKPYTVSNGEGRAIPCFVNVYGFTKKQFNNWMYETLKSYPKINDLEATGFAKQIIEGIKENKEIDIYNKLLKNNTLSESELRRPIFAYMVYQLVINNVDFLIVGKIGVYLSFLNLLTKEAKHIHDKTYKVNLKEEFEFRNVLHATSALWMYERQRGKQGVLKKADICRVLEGKKCGGSDNEVLERFKEEGFTEIQFLSHSYFGENDNVLHFQHQSFAEILLAEYYLKVFIKYALDEDADPEQARVKIMLGEPTEQTIQFLQEMLILLRETSQSKLTNKIIEKRKLLFPLMASLATKKNNRLFCNDIFYNWYNKNKINEYESQYPLDLLQNWCIDEIRIKKIIKLAADILNSKTSYLLMKAEVDTALFNNEVLVLQNQDRNSISPNIDKWLALLVGNFLHNDTTSSKRDVKLKLFNWDYNIGFNYLFEMIRFWNYVVGESSPSWGENLFRGINMVSNSDELSLSHYNFDGIDFSYSYFNKVTCWSTNLSRCKLDHCSFIKARFITSLFFGSTFNEIKEMESFSMSNCDVTPNGFKLFDALNGVGAKFNIFSKISKENTMSKGRRGACSLVTKSRSGDDIFETCSGFFVYGLKNSIFSIDKLKTSFIYDNNKVKAEFLEKLEELRKFEVTEDLEVL